MVWYRAEADVPRHRKTARLRRAIRGEEVGDLARAVGMLHLLWAETCRSKSWGELDGYSVEDIEALCDWEGESGKLVAALLEVGFLEEKEGGFRVHDWDEFVSRDVRRKRGQGESSNQGVAEQMARHGRADAAPRRDPTTTTTTTTLSQVPPSPPGQPMLSLQESGPGDSIPPRLRAAIEAWNRGRKGAVKPAVVEAPAKVRNRDILRRLKEYGVDPAEFEWVARALSADPHKQQWGKATIGWVCSRPAIFEAKLQDGRDLMKQKEAARRREEEYRQKLKEHADALSQGAEPNHEANARYAREVREQLRRQFGEKE